MKNIKKEYDLIVYIGRFEPYHIGHHATQIRAAELSDTVLILVGSASGPRTTRNPWNFLERKDMIFANKVAKHLIVAPINDCTYNEDLWVQQVGAHVAGVKHPETNPRIAIIGYDKDHTSHYLNKFPQWDFIDMEEYKFCGERVDSTNIRNRMYSNYSEYVTDWLPDGSREMTLDFSKTEAFEKAQAAYYWAQDYDPSKYDRPLITVDSIVEQSGHILLVQRGKMPGKDLWAMPGGFIEEYEKLADASLRELREETRLKVPEKVLKGSLKHTSYFDDPHRSSRGRTITHAFLYKLDDATALPKVKGSDDAKDAKWVSFAEFAEMEGEMFEDHFHVIRNMLGKA